MDSPPQLLLRDVNRETAGSAILWSGRPDASGYARRRWPQALMGIPFLAFAVFWTWAAYRGFGSGKHPPPFFALWGCMFIVIGLCMLLSPLFAMWKAGRVYYVVTEQRAIILEKVWSLKIQSFDASGFGGFERVSRGERSGSIIFQRNIVRQGKGTKITEVGFLGLRDFSEAEKALRRMMDAQHKND